ncbi:hypothetical protein [Lysobacter sp. F6437]|uniref:hypothetical protein n=1 Tax=Lysobacter sp. F6437 TaxID=3459296 RepID=UPI00403E14D8
MSRFDSYPDRALELADRVGDSIKHLVPSNAGRWLETGAKLGALKGGARIAGAFVRRNPAIVVATAAGAGLLWYAARRKQRQAADAPIEGSAKRVEARRASATERPRKTSARKRTATKTPSSD